MPEPFQDLDVVALLRDLPEEGLQRGQTGTIVLIHNNGEAYEVEFIQHAGRKGGSTVATIRHEDLLKLREYSRLSAGAS